MASSKNSKSAAVRATLGHSVIDGDGHWLEPIPIFLDFPRDAGGPTVVDKFMKKAKDTSWYEMAPAERMERRPHRRRGGASRAIRWTGPSPWCRSSSTRDSTTSGLTSRWPTPPNLDLQMLKDLFARYGGGVDKTATSPFCLEIPR